MIALIGYVGALVGALVAWLAILVYGFKAVRRARPGVKLWSRETMGNPVNLLLRPSLLTREGRTYRSKCIFAVGAFVVCVGVPLLVAALTGKLR